MAAAPGNRYAAGGINNGQPPMYETADEMQIEIDAYFKSCEGDYEEKNVVDNEGIPKKNEFGEPIIKRKYSRDPEPITITGLALYLGFASRQSLYDYEERGEDFSFVVRRGRTRVENSYERRLDNREKARGSEFALSNMGWTANNKRELTGAGGKDLFDKKSDDELKEELKKISSKLDG